MNIIIRKRFDKGCPNWNTNPEFSEMFLRTQQTYFNNVMQIQEFVFLRDVYMAIGLPVTKESCMLGWAKGVVKDEDFVNIFEYSKIKGTDDFELVFECYPILDYLETEDVVG